MSEDEPTLKIPKIIRADGLDFVTVTYASDLRMLQLQARSLALYLPFDLVNTINIVVNEAQPETVIELIKLMVLPLYGPLSTKVRTWTQLEVAGSHQFVHRGWFSQQVLKLMISAKLDVDGYIILDTKNHFVRKVIWHDFVSREGLLLHRRRSLQKRRSLWPLSLLKSGATKDLPRRFVGTFSYFGLKPEKHCADVVPKTTPFPVYRPIVEKMINVIERKEGVGFAYWFESYFEATEFYLLQAFPAAHGLVFSDYYKSTKSAALVLYPDKPQMEKRLIKMLGKMKASQYYSFGIHRACNERLSAPMRRQIVAFWRLRGLMMEADENYFFQSLPPFGIDKKTD